MAPAKTATRKGVDFDLLDDIEAGDVLQIHFTDDSIGDVAYLVGMIRGGILTSPDELVLLAIVESHDWGGGRNRYVEIIPTETFDRTWFESRMARRVDKLEVRSRKRPLVDVSVLDQPDASLRYRFKPNSVDGVAEMLELHDMELIDLGNADVLREAVEAGEWTGHGRGGHFTSRLTGNDNREYRDYLVTHVVPHLEFLRP